jgi:hypothetical protein
MALHPAVEEVVEYWSMALEREYRAPRTRTRPILEKCEHLVGSFKIPLEYAMTTGYVTADAHPETALFPKLDKAFRALGPEAAMTLFETTEISLLKEIEKLNDYYRYDRLPIWSADKWANELKEEAKFQDQFKFSILSEGILPERPRKSIYLPDWDNNFLAIIVGNLYRAHEIERCLDIRIERIRAAFIRATITDNELLDLLQLPWAPTDGQPLGRLPLPVEGNLKNLRSGLFELRYATLNRLARAFTNRQASEIWSDFVSDMNHWLKIEDVVFLLRLDAACNDQSDFLQYEPEPAYFLGGLTELFYLVGVCEMELTTTSVSSLLEDIDEVKTVLGDGLLYKSFMRDSLYRIMSDYGVSQTLELYEKLRSVRDEREVFWNKFTDRAATTIKDETVEKMLFFVKQKISGDFGRDVKVGQKRQGQENIGIEFIYSVDYRWISVGGREFDLSPNEASIVRHLHEAHLVGIKKVSRASIIEDVSPNSKAEKLRDLFSKPHRSAYHELIDHNGSGMYWLKGWPDLGRDVEKND